METGAKAYVTGLCFLIILCGSTFFIFFKKVENQCSKANFTRSPEAIRFSPNGELEDLCRKCDGDLVSFFEVSELLSAGKSKNLYNANIIDYFTIVCSIIIDVFIFGFYIRSLIHHKKKEENYLLKIDKMQRNEEKFVEDKLKNKKNIMLENELKSAVQRIEEVKKNHDEELHKKQLIIEDLVEYLNEAKEDYLKLKGDLNRYEIENYELKEKMDEDEAVYKLVCEQKDKEIIEYEEQVDKLHADIADLEKQNLKLDAEFDDMQKKYEEKCENLTKEIDIRQEMKNKKFLFETEINELKIAKQELEILNGVLTEQNKYLTCEQQRLSNQLCSSKSKLSKLEKEVQDFRSQQETNLKIVKKQEQINLKQLQTENSKLKEENVTFKTQCRVLSDENVSLRLHLADLNSSKGDYTEWNIAQI